MTIDEILRQIILICKTMKIREVYLFGSRATGYSRERSDIDIAVSGVVDMEQLKEKIDQIPTLISIDVVDMDTCGNEGLLEDVRQYGRKIYEEI